MAQNRIGLPISDAFIRSVNPGKFRQCVEKAIDGQVDRDERYNWTTPGAGLRVGPCLSGIAMAYDFCYDAWDDTFRRRVVKELVEYSHTPVNFGPYNEGAKGPVTLERLVAKPYMPPQSNHYGAFTGGTGIALLAVKGDPGADDQLVSKYLDALQKNMITLLTQGFGDHGYFAEGPGPSHMSVNTGFVPLLQAMKVAGGKDFITPRPNGQWLTLRWVMEIVPREGTPYYPCRHPSTYGTELVARDGMSDGGEFCQGFGAIPEALKPALLWTYAHFVEPGEVAANPRWLKSGQISYDATVYPHRAVLAFINWPIGTPPRNPAELLPRVMEDKARGYYVFRNQWKDENDIVVTAFLDSDSNHGYVKSDRGGPVMVWGLGLRTTMPGAFKNTQAAYFRPRPDGSAVLSAPNNGGVCSLAVDFSGAAGVPALIVQVGPMGDKGKAPAEAKAKSGATARTTTVSAGGQAFAVMTLQAGPAPEVRVDGDKVIVGGQTISFDGAKLVLAKW